MHIILYELEQAWQTTKSSEHGGSSNEPQTSQKTNECSILFMKKISDEVTRQLFSKAFNQTTSHQQIVLILKLSSVRDFENAVKIIDRLI